MECVHAQGAMDLGVRMKAASGEKIVAHSSYKVYALSSRNIAKLPVLA